MYAKHGFVACLLRILRQESMFHPKSVIRKNFLSFLMTAIRKLALYKLDL